MGEAKRKKQLGLSIKERPTYQAKVITEKSELFPIPEELSNLWNDLNLKSITSSYDLVELTHEETVYAIAHYYQQNSKLYAQFILEPTTKLSQVSIDTFSKILCRKKLKTPGVFIF
jgi:hypothetical protein